MKYPEEMYIDSQIFAGDMDGRRVPNNDVPPDWCPLKLLPEKDTKNHFPDEFEDGYAAGWNGCIDEITGGSSDD
jgi:hypothetical protein